MQASMPGLSDWATPYPADASQQLRSDHVYPEDVAAAGAVERRKARPRIFRVQRPARMLARIHTIKLAVQHRDGMHVAGAGHEIHEQHRLTRLDVVLDQSWHIAFIARHLGVLGAIDQ